MEKTAKSYLDNVSGLMTINVTKMRQQKNADNYVSITNPILHIKYCNQEFKSVDYNIAKQEVNTLDNEGTEELPCWKEAFTFTIVGFDKLSDNLEIQVYDSDKFIGEMKSKA